MPDPNERRRPRGAELLGTPTPAEMMRQSTAARMVDLQQVLRAIQPSPVVQMQSVLAEVNAATSGFTQVAAQVKAVSEAFAQMVAPSAHVWEQVMREVQASMAQTVDTLAVLQRLTPRVDVRFAAVGASIALQLADATVTPDAKEAAQDDAATANVLQWVLSQLFVGLSPDARERASRDPQYLLGLLGIVVTLVVGLGSTAVNSAVTLLKPSPPPTIVVQPAEVQTPDVHVHIDSDDLQGTIDDAVGDAVERELSEHGIGDPDH